MRLSIATVLLLLGPALTVSASPSSPSAPAQSEVVVQASTPDAVEGLVEENPTPEPAAGLSCGDNACYLLGCSKTANCVDLGDTGYNTCVAGIVGRGFCFGGTYHQIECECSCPGNTQIDAVCFPP